MSLACEAKDGMASDSSPQAADMSGERGAEREGREEWRHEVGGRRFGGRKQEAGEPQEAEHKD